MDISEVHHYHFVKLSEIIGVDTDIPETEDKSGQGTTTPHKLNNQDDFTFTGKQYLCESIIKYCTFLIHSIH